MTPQRAPSSTRSPFTSLYLLEDEWAAEIANRTMHGVMHIGWVRDGSGGYRGQMAVYVRPNGMFGTAYLAAIRPFRHLIVYPAMIREIERKWLRRVDDPTPAHALVAGKAQVPTLSAGRSAVLYDADCGFCKWLLSILLRWDHAVRLQPIALQRSEADDLLQELRPAERMASFHLVSPAGERRSGGAAVEPLLRMLPAGGLPAAVFARCPRVADRGYRWVAEHRSQLSNWVPPSAKHRASERVEEREQERETH